MVLLAILGLMILLSVSRLISKRTRNNTVAPEEMHKLVLAYPDHLKEVQGNYVLWKDGTRMQLWDSITDKTVDSILIKPSLQDHFRWPYFIKYRIDSLPKYQDPGRARYLPFFKKMYGENEDSVRQNMVKVIWLPNYLGDTLLVTRVNDVDKRLISISNELEKLVAQDSTLLQYLERPGGTFNWRKISGTDRLSAHSFGMTIDINVKFSNYWQWDVKTKDEHVDLPYKNRIPMRIVKVFEDHGFIWGGRWYHYDTMHFEYRPELLP